MLFLCSINSTGLNITAPLSPPRLLPNHLHFPHNLLPLLSQRVPVDVERNVFNHLVGHNQHDHESVGRVRADRKTQLQTSSVEEVIPVF
jgi:hypothetical protein